MKENTNIETSGILEDFQENRNLLVSFGGILQGLGMPIFEFYNSLSSLKCDKIFVRDFNQLWYHAGVDDEINTNNKLVKYLREKLDGNQYKRVCFLGNSMGGYAAILFGSLLNVDQVIAFAPQTFVDRWNRWKYYDRRWQSQLKKLHEHQSKEPAYLDLKKHLKSCDSIKTKFHLFASSENKLDHLHIKRMENLPNIELSYIDEGGHNIVKTARDSGQLISVLKNGLK